jgi:putative tryptophan/tyrosine transport system substrate-binding protein
LHELGWVEGQNLLIEYRWAEGRFDRLPDLAAELVRLKVDVIAASPAPATRAAKTATTTIPIVFLGVSDPAGQGLIASLPRPGGNITGLTYGVGSNIYGKDLELLKEVVPKVRQVAVLYNPTNPGHQLILDEVKGAARSLGLQLQLVKARGP